MRTHRPPSRCPVCSDRLITLRLGCPTCATEIAGHFGTCRFCQLDPADTEILEVFLRGRGNFRDVQAHLGVSYPTARARVIDVLDRLDLGQSPPPQDTPDPAPPIPVAQVLADLAAGRLDVATAQQVLRGDDS